MAKDVVIGSAEKRNDGFFTEGFLKFGPNNIRNFADLFKTDFDKSSFEDFNDNQENHADYEEGVDTFIPTQYDDDDSNINYVDDYYEGEGASSFETPNFVQDGHGFDTRGTSFDSFSSYEDSQDDFHHTGPGS